MREYANFVRRRTFACLAALSAVALVVAAPAPAQADEWGPVVAPGVLFYTDNSGITSCATDGFEEFVPVAQYALDVIDNTTDLSHDTPIGECEFDQTDVWWSSTNLEGSVRGRTTCRLVAPTDITSCQGHLVEMDFAQLDIGDLDWEDRRKTAVHELGHVAGLQHGTPDGAGSAMISGEIPNANLQFRRYSTHHINSHLNVRY